MYCNFQSFNKWRKGKKDRKGKEIGTAFHYRLEKKKEKKMERKALD